MATYRLKKKLELCAKEESAQAVSLNLFMDQACSTSRNTVTRNTGTPEHPQENPEHSPKTRNIPKKTRNTSQKTRNSAKSKKKTQNTFNKQGTQGKEKLETFNYFKSYNTNVHLLFLSLIKERFSAWHYHR